jgi:hypothetical protein
MSYDLYKSVENISKIDLKQFTYKNDSDEQVHLGFIAHELQEIIPYAVEGDKDAVDENGNPVFQKVKPGMIVPDIVASLQWIFKKIEEIEKDKK